MTRLMLVILALLHAPSSSAQSSREYAVMMQAAWAAFECSTIARYAEEAEDAQRQLAYGIQQGRLFLWALRTNRINAEDLKRYAPFATTLLLEGPTDDFILGTVRASAGDPISAEIVKRDASDRPSSSEAIKNRAQSLYTKKNCSALGPTR